MFKHSTRSTYISQVEQWWQRSGLTIWQWSQYRMACWEKMEEKKSGQMQFLYNGLKEDIKKKSKERWLLLTRRGPNCNGGSLQDLDAVSTLTTGQFWKNEMVDNRGHCCLRWESLTPTCLLCGRPCWMPHLLLLCECTQAGSSPLSSGFLAASPRAPPAHTTPFLLWAK